ncbi:neuron navigator 1 isoform X6 [Neoarius graeffei]|uniref:neuron navigator 1 isoform X6 n=1 Tax=Neoarius graeffei TaxID=443677 RepID=UPI00298D1C04|nr:neuron navigator 1 isoform X6 [Neoarius graeffei]
MAAKRGKSGVPQNVARSELKVYRTGSTEGRIPVPTNLRKQRSLTNLAVLTDAEKKMQLYEPKWCDDMGKASTSHLKTGKPKPTGGGGGPGSAQLSRNLSKSEHSLFQAKPKPFTPLAAPGALGKTQSRIPRGPYAEVKPLSKAADDGKSDDDILSSKAKVADRESQRKRTVQNVLDLRQNLEDTMSSLRGTQLSHGCLDSSMCYDSDDTNARSVSSLSNRSSPLSWRHGQASPRLQAGDAPSSTGYPLGSKAASQYTSHTMPARCSSRISNTSHIELIENLDTGDGDLKSGYLSDSDLMSKSLNEDDDDDDNLANGWDESSSISSGLSDGSDNLSSEDLNASSSLNSLPTTPVGSRRNSSVMLRTDAEKRSLVESGLAWYSEDNKALQKADSGAYDTGSLKTESSSKYRKSKPAEGVAQEKTARRELKKPQSLGQPGSFKKSQNPPPVGVTSPITHTSQSVLKVAATKGDAKVVDKQKLSLKTSGLQRSRSDAGRDSVEHRKPPSGLVKPTAGSFGYRKTPTTGTATVMTAGGATISSGSATVGKTPKSSGIPTKPVPGGGSRKNSLDASNGENGFLAPNARGSIQYRSLPRPAKSSAMSLTGRAASRPVSSSIDASLLSLKPMPALPATMPTRGKDGGSIKAGSRTSNVGPVNQTDREKEKERAKAKADLENNSLKSENQRESCGENAEQIHRTRRTSTSKYPELSSPTTTQRTLAKSLAHPPSLAHLDKVNSNSLDTCVTIEDLPPKIPPYSKLQDLVGSRVPSRLTPSPAPVLNIDSPSCFSGQPLSLSSSPLLYPKMSGVHHSMESLSLHMSLPPSVELGDQEETTGRTMGTWGAGTRTSVTLNDSLQTDRNTLPKQGLSRYSSSQSEGEGKERRHSHTIMSMTESESPPQLPSPTHLSQSFAGKTPPTNVVAPITSSNTTPRITRSNSIPANEGSYDLYASSPLGSSISLADRPKSMMRSGSFREPGEDVHGSVLSLASNASSNYSSTEERMQGEQIRKLRRELEASQDKVANLTSQLSANYNPDPNTTVPLSLADVLFWLRAGLRVLGGCSLQQAGQANLVAAFEQSLTLMTARLQSLSVTSEQKDVELQDLRETIEVLKSKNTEAQVIIHGALNNPDSTPKELQINRQNSSESIASMNSITSHSSLGSLKEQDAKKKKKKSWLRSSFNRAFYKKGSKSYSDIEEIATPESSTPSSPKIHHDVEKAPFSLDVSTSASSSGLGDSSEGIETDEKVVSELRSELWEKERKLTDIRLEALSSAHQLEQLQEAMSKMQMTVENLKAENDQLKTGVSRPPSSTSQSSGLGSLGTSSPRQSVASLSKTFSMGATESLNTDVFQSPTSTLQKDESFVRVLVRIPNQQVFNEEAKQLEFFIGLVKLSGQTDWCTLDSAICQAFKDYLSVVDPSSSLGLSQDSIYSYSLSHLKRVLGVQPPETPPVRCLSKTSTCINVALKGLKEKCVDNVVFETLIPKPMIQHYISLLLKHRRLILSGPSGTGKTYLSSRLAEYLIERSAREITPAIAVSFNMHHQTCKDLQLYLSNLANQIDRETSTSEVPLVVVLDDVHDAASISELVNGALTCKYHKCPYIIGTTNQPVKMTPNHSLHLSFRMVMFSNNVEPANGFLVRYLHRKLMEAEDPRSLTNEDLLRVLDWVPKLWYHLHTFLEKHSTSDFLIGPCFFLSCPVTVEEFRCWFIDLWNHSIIPYLQEGAKDGIKAHGQKAVWEDPVEWVRDSLPWPSAQQDQAKLFHLPPPSTGPVSPSQAGDERPHKETPPSSMESDPLMAMLLKLQEAANYIESPEKEADPKLPTL